MPKHKLPSSSLKLELDMYLLELCQEEELLVDIYTMSNCSEWIHLDSESHRTPACINFLMQSCRPDKFRSYLYKSKTLPVFLLWR